jgi:hypothetical protein
MSFKLGNQTCIDPKMLYRQCVEHGWRTDQFFGKCNMYSCGRGMKPGVGYLLMLRGQLGKENGGLDLDKFHDLTLYSPLENTKKPAFKRVVKNLTITKMTCCLPGWDDDPNAPFL